VDDRAAGEVEGTQLEEPAVGGPDPVGERRVDEDRPEDGEEDEGTEPLALGEGAGDERGRDGGEHELEAGEEDERDRDAVDRARLGTDVHEAEEVEPADETETGDVRAEGDGEPDEHPDDADEGEAEEAVHDRGQDVLATDEPAVEEGEAGQHHHDHRRGDEQPGGVATVDRRAFRGRSHTRDQQGQHRRSRQAGQPPSCLPHRRPPRRLATRKRTRPPAS
jgi:hypothetical protein